jgi:hypothetical protein
MGKRYFYLVNILIAAPLMFLGCRTSPPEFVRARIVVMPSPASALRPTSLEISDPAKVNHLVAFFTELGQGRVSKIAGGWMTEVRITFFTEDGKELMVQIDPDLEYWTEGHGDWELAPEFKGYLTEVLTKGEEGAIKSGK